MACKVGTSYPLRLEGGVQGYAYYSGDKRAAHDGVGTAVCQRFPYAYESIMEDFPSYLAAGPQGLLESCDLLLTLDDGSELPVHSQVMARCSLVFQGMVNEGVLLNASAATKITLPFSECSRKEATDFLCVIYSMRSHVHIDEASALPIARLGNKYGVQVHVGWPLSCVNV